MKNRVLTNHIHLPPPPYPLSNLLTSFLFLLLIRKHTRQCFCFVLWAETESRKQRNIWQSISLVPSAWLYLFLSIWKCFCLFFLLGFVRFISDISLNYFLLKDSYTKDSLLFCNKQSFFFVGVVDEITHEKGSSLFSSLWIYLLSSKILNFCHK